MSEIMQARAVMTKKINVMARKIEGITTFVLTGNDEYSPNEIYYVVAAAGDNAPPKVVTDMNFLIREFLKPSDIKKNESDGRTLVDYVFEGGLNAQVIFCGEKNLPSFEWWVPYMDKNGAALGFYSASGRRSSDPTTEKPSFADDFSDDFSDDFEDDFDDVAPVSEEPVKSEPIAVSEPVVSEPVAELLPEPVPEPVKQTPVVPEQHQPLDNEQGQSEREMWNFFYSKVNVAKHAISGGSIIYACETIGELRTLLIRLICEANGISDDYIHSIDLLPENHRAALMKTYPSKLENGPMISALAAELSIFEELMKRSSR